MNVLIIGNGAREHAIAWKIAQNPRVGSIFCAPGNAGTAQLGQNIAVDPTDINSLVKAALANNIYLTVVGPEVPLARGIVDHFVIRGMQIFGPIQAASQLESSKVFAKRFMLENNIPTALSRSFSDYEQALGYTAN
ncbi:MAG: phosphoribosylamine--glycine ligase, partial [Dehalococcoidia bacterium]